MSDDEKLLLELQEITKEMILDYFDHFFKELNYKPGFILDGLKNVFTDFKFEIDFYSKERAVAECKYRESKIVFYESFFHQTRLEQIATFIHEYAHAISYRLSHQFISSILEEGMADVLEELVINHAIKTNKFDELASKELQSKKYYLSSESKGYLPCRELVKTLLAMLHMNNADLDGIRYYFFIAKHGFNLFFNDSTNLKIEELNSFFNYHVAMECAEEQDKYIKVISELIFEYFGDFLDQINLDKLINMCSNRQNDYSSTYYFHNLILERYIFDRALKLYMPTANDITVENFIKLAKKCKGILNGHRFRSEELDNVLITLYQKEPTKFKRILSHISYLPSELATQVLNKRLENSEDCFKTTTKLFKSVDFELEKSIPYLAYYDPNRNKKDKFVFLSRLLHSDKIDSCYYFSELLYNFDFGCLSHKDNVLVLKCLNNYLKYNIKFTDDCFCLKTFKMIELYLERIKSKFYNDPNYVRVKNLHKVVKIRYLNERKIIQNAGLLVDLEEYELNINYSDFNNYGLILNLIINNDVILYKRYFINILYQMILLMPDSLKKGALNKLKETNNKDLNELLLMINADYETKKQYS